MSHRRNTVLSAALAAGLTAPLSQAGSPRPVGKQDGTTTTAPAAVAAAAGKTQCVVLDVKGNVGVIDAGGTKSKRAVKDMELSEGAVINTSHNSAIMIRIGAGQVLTIDKMTKVELRQAISDAGTDKTVVDLPYGRVKFNISSTEVANSVQIVAPDATLAVKGTEGLIDSTPGFPTVASGAETNTGRFSVTNAAGVSGDVTGDQTATSDNPAPAAVAESDVTLDTGAAQARDGDESEVVARATGGGDAPVLTIGSTPPPPPPVPQMNPQFFIDDGSRTQSGPSLVRLNDDGTFTTVRSGGAFAGSFDPGVVAHAGLALQTNASTGARRVLRLEWDPDSGYRLLSLDLADPASVFTSLSSNSQSAPTLFGLGTIGPRIFSIGRPSQGDSTLETRIYEFDLANNQALARMHLPMQDVGRDLGGLNSRGTLFAFGRVADFAGFDRFYDGAFLEIDPRNNYLAGITGPLVTGPSTIFDPLMLSPSSLNNGVVTGIGTINNNIIASIMVEGTRYFVAIDPTAAGTTNDPTIRRIALTLAGVTGGLGGESTISPPGPRSLSNPAGGVDSFISPLVGAMAYRGVAANSSFLRQMVAGEVVRTSVDTSECFSTLLPSDLGPFLASNVNRVSGVGRSVFDFRATLPFGHPCLAPGQVGLFPDTVFLDDAGNLRGYNLDESTLLLRPNLTYTPDSALAGFGLSILSSPSGSRLLMRLETVDLGSEFNTQIYTLDLANRTGDFVSMSDYTGSVRLTGAGTIGPGTVYAMGEETSASGGNTITTGIYEVLPGDGGIIKRMSLPLDFDGSFDVAGSNVRGSLFVIGDASFDYSGSDNPLVFEVDPRNNYFRLVNELFTNGATVFGAGVDPLAFDNNNLTLLGSAFINGRLVGVVRDEDLQVNYFVQINPLATGNNPTVVRVSLTNFNASGLASETPVLPPPLTPLNGPGLIDQFMDNTLAQAAYSSQVAGSPFFQLLVAREIDRSSANPGLCINTPELQGLDSFLFLHTNQIGGVGSAVFDFRTTLPFAHPCLGPGQVGQLPPIFFFDENGDLIGRDPFNEVEGIVAAGIGGATPELEGLAFVGSAGSQGGLYRLVGQSVGTSSSSWTLKFLDLANTGAGFTNIETNSFDDVKVGGLGAIHTQIFVASAFEPLSMGFGEQGLFLSEIGFGDGQRRDRGFFPSSNVQLGLTGSNERGSLFAVADVLGSTTGDVPFALIGQVIEFDPRTQYLANVFEFIIGPSTVIDPSIEPSQISAVDGMAYVGDKLILAVRTVNGDRAFVLFDPTASGTAQDPTVLRISGSARIFGELAGESRVTPPPSVTLDEFQIIPDLRVNPTFALMGYSSQSIFAVQAMVENHILATSQDSAFCPSSGALNVLSSIVPGHVNQVAGIGQTLADFRNGIPFNHPCQLPQDQIGFFSIDEDNLTLAQVNLTHGILPFGSISGFNPISATPGMGMVVSGGLTQVSQPLSRTLFRLESLDSGAGYLNTLRMIDSAPGTNQNSFLPVETFTSVPGPLLTGLAAIGQDLYVSGRLGEGGRFGIAQLDVANGTMTTLIDAPLLGALFDTCALGSSNERGTLFIPSAAGPPGMGVPFSILEFDPRNNLLVDARSTGGAFALTVSPDTINNATMFTSFSQMERVTSISYNQGAVTVGGTITTGNGSQPIIFTIDMAGTNSPGNPVVTRASDLPRRSFGFAGQLPITPPPPASISNPPFPGGIDMRGLSAQFAAMAYTQNAFNSGVPTALIRNAIAASARDIDGCLASSEIGNLPSIVQGNINFRSGVGRSVTEFRNNLPTNHPCQPN
ncbi:MAG: FecR domain-containing protein [Phycisphaerales bacterium]